jgi:hypothetical protein
MEHWNIQVSVQRVTEDQPVTILSGKPPVRKTVLQVIDLKLQAESEVEAYDKLSRVLTAVHPEVQVVPAGYEITPTPRPIRDNPQA